MIEFSRPIWLYGVLGLAALWLLRSWWRRRRRRPIASLPFLERALAKLGATRPGSIWRERLRDLALVLALATLFAALAEPRVWLPRPAATEYALVIDVSASMSTREDDGRTRIEWAQEIAQSLIAQRGPREQLLLALATDETEIVAPLGSDADLLRRRVQSVTWTPASDDLWRAVRRVRPASSPQRRVLLISDFSSSLGRRLAAAPPEGVYLYPVGEASENLGLEGASWLPGRSEIGNRLRFDLVDHGPADESSERAVEVSLTAGDEILRDFTVNVPRGGRATVDERIPFDRDGSLILAIETEDQNALAIDDRAYFVTSGRDRLSIRAWLGSPEDPHLAALIEVLGEELCEVERLPEAAAVWEPAPGAVVVANDLEIDRPLPAGRYLLFASRGARAPVRSTRERTSGPVVRWDLGHPAVRGLIFDDVAVKDSPVLAPEADQTALLASDDGALAAAQLRSDARVVSVAFSPAGSTWWSSGSFPLFVIQALRWLSGSEAQLPAGVLAGEPIPVDPELGDHPGRGPGLPVEDAPGFRKLEDLPGAPVIGVSFERPRESTISPGAEELPRPAPELELQRVELAVWLAALALALILLVAWLSGPVRAGSP